VTHPIWERGVGHLYKMRGKLEILAEQSTKSHEIDQNYLQKWMKITNFVEN
jgi:hypothetical protein